MSDLHNSARECLFNTADSRTLLSGTTLRKGKQEGRRKFKSWLFKSYVHHSVCIIFFFFCLVNCLPVFWWETRKDTWSFSQALVLFSFPALNFVCINYSNSHRKSTAKRIFTLQTFHLLPPSPLL